MSRSEAQFYCPPQRVVRQWSACCWQLLRRCLRTLRPSVCQAFGNSARRRRRSWSTRGVGGGRKITRRSTDSPGSSRAEARGLRIFKNFRLRVNYKTKLFFKRPIEHAAEFRSSCTSRSYSSGFIEFIFPLFLICLRYLCRPKSDFRCSHPNFLSYLSVKTR